jgi:hypothetical protein
MLVRSADFDVAQIPDDGFAAPLRVGDPGLGVSSLDGFKIVSYKRKICFQPEGGSSFRADVGEVAGSLQQGFCAGLDF